MSIEELNNNKNTSDIMPIWMFGDQNDIHPNINMILIMLFPLQYFAHRLFGCILNENKELFDDMCYLMSFVFTRECIHDRDYLAIIVFPLDCVFFIVALVFQIVNTIFQWICVIIASIIIVLIVLIVNIPTCFIPIIVITVILYKKNNYHEINTEESV